MLGMKKKSYLTFRDFLSHQQTCKKLFGACTSWYKPGKSQRAKARSKISQVISENSCRSEGRVIIVVCSQLGGSDKHVKIYTKTWFSSRGP